ncbi:MAG: FAD-dependent oxidoreductase [Coriobacteriia bacterium]|nr:FAD-dependent oxidoreductase [Coriobacteriia bacterium]MBS5477077.1 FAD-dependent oxidoreductase [Coriobacteriia bacterium]
MSTSLSRRSFVAGGLAAATGMSALALSGSRVLADEAPAASPSPTSAPQSWDAEADIIAIGGGAAGLSAGIEAADQGLSCIVLESQGICGGNSIRCNGGMTIPGSPLQAEMGIEDSADQMYEDMCAWFAHDYDEQYVRMLCDLDSTMLYDWLTGMGLVYEQSGLVQSNGHSRPREHHVNPYNLISLLEENARAKGAQIDFETHADHLIQDPETRQVIGVQATRDGQTIYYHANRAVILCNGGYGRNAAFLNQHVFGEGAERYVESAYDAPGIDGSGMLMAMELGADTRHLSYHAMLSVQNPDGIAHDACAMIHQGAVMVNLEGQRFVNEGQGYTNVWVELDAQPESVCFQVWDDDIAQACADNESSYYSQAKVAATGLLLQADTFEDLAAQMGVPADAFAATMEAYNASVSETGVDDAFGRAHTVGDGAVPPALDTPPFYAFKTTNVLCTTYGGLKRWEGDGLQAVDVFGQVIPGLYLAGAISDYCNMGIMPGTRRPINASGTSLSGAMSFARACVQAIAGAGEAR